ncbi:MAG: HAD-IIA family hydrolase [Propionibacteriaceae bacterium]|nr:HAD-IIA family hydrolase [Propionibacteriaceae bacterium]
MSRLVDAFDAALFDLDGVIYLGPLVIDGVTAALDTLRDTGIRVGFVTNNAARTPAAVAAHLVELDIPATASDVVNSTQATVRMLQADLPAGSKLLVVGTEALADQLREGGFTPVQSLDQDPIAVVQGYHPAQEWSQLEMGAIAVQNGAIWYATNPDMTRPTERGILPGCGAQVAVIRACVDVDPKVAGKPFRPLLDETVLRLAADHPIFVGDRLDTDIMGANVVGMASLFVFTGAHGKADLASADESSRPTHIGFDVSALLMPARMVEAHEEGHVVSCGQQQISVTDGTAHIMGEPEGVEEQLDALWALLHAAWHLGADVGDELPQLDLLR